MKGGRNLVAAAFALTALSYGLARFAYGLLLPQIRETLSLSATAAGWIGAAAFAAYCLGIVIAALAGRRLGERMMAVLAGLTATGGMALVALAPSAPLLGAAIALAGLSSGFTSPPLAAAVARHFGAAARPRANGAINAGTAIGIVFSGLAALAFATAWREVYGLFALLGLGVTAWIWYALPPGHGRMPAAPTPAPPFGRTGLGSLCAAALMMGASSTAIWTFGADLLRQDAGYTEAWIALSWIALGLGGLGGGLTGSVVARLGTGWSHRLALLAMVACYGLVGLAGTVPGLGFAAMALFGTAYIVSSGVLLIRGTSLLPYRPDLGLGLPFLALAAGQTGGALAFGALLDGAGHGVALALSIALACGAMAWRMEGAA